MTAVSLSPTQIAAIRARINEAKSAPTSAPRLTTPDPMPTPTHNPGTDNTLS